VHPLCAQTVVGVPYKLVNDDEEELPDELELDE
jgi:hypothetical protein